MRRAYTPVSVKISRAKPAKLRFTDPMVESASFFRVKSQDMKGSLTCANCDIPASMACSGALASVSAVVSLLGLSPDSIRGVLSFSGADSIGRYENRSYFLLSGAQRC